jgi:hypothetical protein
MELLPSGHETYFCGHNDLACCRVIEACKELAIARTKGELGRIVAEEILKFSVFDLQVICGRIYHEINRLPSPYREAVRPYFLQQFYECHHQILLMYRTGSFSIMRAPLTNPGLFMDFLAMIIPGCFSHDQKSDYVPQLSSPVQTLFYYLVACFTMFVLERPGHPVGMPFPGGFRVEERRGQFLCPVRDKEKEVPFSICNFCPAVQNPEPQER